MSFKEAQMTHLFTYKIAQIRYEYKNPEIHEIRRVSCVKVCAQLVYTLST